VNGLELALAPLVIVGLWALLVPLAGVVAPGWSRVVALGGVLLALAAALSLLAEARLGVGGSLLGEALVVDRLGLALELVVLVALAVLVGVEAPGRGSGARHGLLLVAGAGALLCVHAGDLSTLVAGLELACVAAGVLLWLGRAGGGAAGRGGFTWLIGQGLAGGLLWLGLGLIYGATGTTRLAELGGRVGAVFLHWGASAVQAAVDLLHSREPLTASLLSYSRDAAVQGAAPAMLLIPGLGLALVGLLARFGAAPLHLATPAAVQRAGAGAAGAVLVLVRVAAAAAMLRLLVAVLHAPRMVYAPYGWGTAAGLVGALSAVVGAVAAVRAVDMRRLLAWAWVAQAGLLVLGMLAAADFYAHAGARSGGLRISDHVDWGQSAGDAAVAAVLLCLAMHAIATLGLLAGHVAFERGRGLADYAGLGRRAPVSGVALSLCLLGLAGAPPTGAFVARLALLQAGLEDSNLLVRVALAVGLIAGAGLAGACLRVLALLWSEPTGASVAGRGVARTALAVLSTMLLATGLYGQVILEAARAAGAGAGLTPGGAARRAWIEASEAADREADERP
jgi:NADH-quinone oxidoreductase subunit N